MASIKVRRGTEGPAHDPYSYTEITFYFTNPRRKPVVYHGGLGEWVRHGKRKYESRWRGMASTDDKAADVFERLTGMSVRKAEEVPHILEQRMLKALPPARRWAVLQCMEADAALLRWAR